jgi:lipopolysaccharide/colanic/teichoic acid biosynthesis glycosyltransferase
LFLQRFYQIQAPLTSRSKDNGLMMATNLAAVRETRERARVRTVPAAINLLYALEPVAAALCLICLSPFLVILALAIYAASGASPLVAHRRVGRHGKTLWVYKFRSMWPRGARARESGFLIEKVADDEPKPKLGPDPRVTSGFASFCRRHSIDELPQLALVATGQMSIVGPRPITRFELSEYYEPDAMEVLSVKPGLTGLWQIRGRSRLTYRQRKRFDLFLVRRFSAGLYFRIVALTLPDLLFAKDAW